ncbi:MAG: hypothetical protein IJ520_12780 [Synergistaceae bacterium]|nr:hypothetical protein [Synergistaceae bacterium]
MSKLNILEMIQASCLMDDVFMSECLKDIKCVELVLSIILEHEVKVERVQTQEVMRSWGRSVRLDIIGFESTAPNNTNERYNLEVQRSDEGAEVRRARYHISIMDTNSLVPGQEFKELGDNYVIFITENDVFKRGLPRYTLERVIKETGELVNDGTHIIYINASMRDTNTPLGKLSHDFFCVKPDEFCYPVLADRVRYFKEDKRGSEEMSGLYKRFIEPHREEILAEGRAEERQNIINNLMKNRGMTKDEAMQLIGLSGAV